MCYKCKRAPEIISLSTTAITESLKTLVENDLLEAITAAKILKKLQSDFSNLPIELAPKKKTIEEYQKDFVQYQETSLELINSRYPEE